MLDVTIMFAEEVARSEGKENVLSAEEGLDWVLVYFSLAVRFYLPVCATYVSFLSVFLSQAADPPKWSRNDIRWVG